MAAQHAVFANGMVTAVGFNAPACCAAFRAGISNIQIENLWNASPGEALQAGRPHMPQWWEGPDMLAELVAPPIIECHQALNEIPEYSHLDPKQIPILLILAPESRPFRWPNLDQRIMDDLAHKLGMMMPKGSIVIPRGRTGIVQAFKYASELRQDNPLCIIAGVESFMRQEIVEYYIEERRLKCSDNSNGFIPGEAAGAVLVGAPMRIKGPEVLITGMGLKQDPSGAGGNENHPSTGKGLTNAMREALKQAGHDYWALDLRLADLNGEHWKFKEAAFAAGRLDRLRPKGTPPRQLGYVDIWHPIEYMGDVGAAIFPILLGWTFEAYKKGYDCGPKSLLFASEDDGERAAMTVEFSLGKE